MIEYPKIETLFDRDDKTKKVLPEKVRCPEFLNIHQWLVTEKIDGTNIRICLQMEGTVKIGGRTDSAQMCVSLTEYLYKTFTPEKLKQAFWKPNEPPFEVILFGEGYGPKIQSGGKYRPDVSVRLFDVLIGPWWLRWGDIVDVADRLEIRVVPLLCKIEYLPKSVEELKKIVPHSDVAMMEKGDDDCAAEGIVAREPNGMFMRNGKRVMWKLKFKDF